MAALPLPAPGSRFGPCEDANCGHKDCEFTRRQAGCLCTVCGEPIGYDRAMYVVGSISELAHAVCLEEQVEKELSARNAPS